jgi:hypothetical protein
VTARLPCSSMSSELESVNLPAELLDEDVLPSGGALLAAWLTTSPTR